MTIKAQIIADSVSVEGNRLTTFQLNELFVYDPMTGILTHKRNRRGVTAGSIAGSIKSDGYVHLKIFGVEYYAHRIIWQMVYGDDLPPMVDHKDTVRSNNRLANLRAATPGQNMANSYVRKDNKSGVKGVRKLFNRWTAAITVNGKQIHLGMFSTIEEASAAYSKASVVHHGAFARS